MLAVYVPIIRYLGGSYCARVHIVFAGFFCSIQSYSRDRNGSSETEYYYFLWQMYVYRYNRLHRVRQL